MSDGAVEGGGAPALPALQAGKQRAEAMLRSGVLSDEQRQHAVAELQHHKAAIRALQNLPQSANPFGAAYSGPGAAQPPAASAMGTQPWHLNEQHHRLMQPQQPHAPTAQSQQHLQNFHLHHPHGAMQMPMPMGMPPPGMAPTMMAAAPVLHPGMIPPIGMLQSPAPYPGTIPSGYAQHPGMPLPQHPDMQLPHGAPPHGMQFSAVPPPSVAQMSPAIPTLSSMALGGVQGGAPSAQQPPANCAALTTIPPMTSRPPPGMPVPSAVHDVADNEPTAATPGPATSSGELTPAVRIAVDKVAPFVAQLGEMFLKQMQQSHATDPTYGFLFPGDSPARHYYLAKLRECGGIGSGYTPGPTTSTKTTQPDVPSPVVSKKIATESAGHGWQELTEPATGRKYYANRKTGVTTWVKPGAMALEGSVTASEAVRQGRELAGWRECEITRDGATRCYYYNATLGVTQWQKPDEFAVEERKAASGEEAPAPEASAQATPGGEDASHGEDAGTAPAPDTAVVPNDDRPALLPDDGVKDIEAEALRASVHEVDGDAGGDGAGTGGMSKRARREARRREREAEAELRKRGRLVPMQQQQATPQGVLRPTMDADASSTATVNPEQASEALPGATSLDAESAFRQMLREVSQQQPLLLEMDWDVALRHFMEDSRYSAIKTPAQRKSIFLDFQATEADAVREAARARRAEARRAFTAMLCECKDLDHRDSLARAKSLLEKDPRWGALPALDRANTFEEARADIRRAEEDRAREREVRLAEAELVLREKLCGMGLRPSATWGQVAAMDAVAMDSRFALLGEERKRQVWTTFHTELVRTERENAKAGYDELLEEEAAAGRLRPSSEWRDLGEHLLAQPRARRLAELQPDAPMAAFTRFVAALADRRRAEIAYGVRLAMRAGELGSMAEREEVFAAMESVEAVEQERSRRLAAASQSKEGDSAELRAKRLELREAEAALEAVSTEVEEADPTGDMRREIRERAHKSGAEQLLAATGEIGRRAPLRLASLCEETREAIFSQVRKRLEAAEAEAARRHARARRRFRDLCESLRDIAGSGTSFSEWGKVRSLLDEPHGSVALGEDKRRQLWEDFCAEVQGGEGGSERNRGRNAEAGESKGDRDAELPGSKKKKRAREKDKDKNRERKRSRSRERKRSSREHKRTRSRERNRGREERNGSQDRFRTRQDNRETRARKDDKKADPRDGRKGDRHEDRRGAGKRHGMRSPSSGSYSSYDSSD